MPKKAAQKPVEEKQDSHKNKKAVPVSEPEADVTAQAQAVPATEANTRASKKQSKQRASTKKASVKDASAPSANADSSAVTSDSDAHKTRHVPTRESVEKEFEELVASIDEEINKLRSSTTKSKGVKFLRTMNKRVKTLRNHALRVSKQRTSTRRKNTNSGFLKPVQISKDLAKFTGWDQSQLRSRVDVTKYICDYIKEHNLQDPEDKRNIRVDQDANLKKLLKFEAKDGKPLTYYRLQTYLKSHFSPAPEVANSSVTEVAAPTPAGGDSKPAKNKAK